MESIHRSLAGGVKCCTVYTEPNSCTLGELKKKNVTTLCRCDWRHTITWCHNSCVSSVHGVFKCQCVCVCRVGVGLFSPPVYPLPEGPLQRATAIITLEECGTLVLNSLWPPRRRRSGGAAPPGGQHAVRGGGGVPWMGAFGWFFCFLTETLTLAQFLSMVPLQHKLFTFPYHLTPGHHNSTPNTLNTDGEGYYIHQYSHSCIFSFCFKLSAANNNLWHFRDFVHFEAEKCVSCSTYFLFLCCFMFVKLTLVKSFTACKYTTDSWLVPSDWLI